MGTDGVRERPGGPVAHYACSVFHFSYTAAGDTMKSAGVLVCVTPGVNVSHREGYGRF